VEKSGHGHFTTWDLMLGLEKECTPIILQNLQWPILGCFDEIKLCFSSKSLLCSIASAMWKGYSWKLALSPDSWTLMPPPFSQLLIVTLLSYSMGGYNDIISSAGSRNFE